LDVNFTFPSQMQRPAGLSDEQWAEQQAAAQREYLTRISRVVPGRGDPAAPERRTTMNTKREDLPLAEQGQPKDRSMATQPSHDDMERMRREDPLFLEKTRPEDPSGRAGQLTRDNVNPHIPSGKRGDPPGPIVDPASLGMPQGGVAPTGLMKPENPIGARFEDARYDDLNKETKKVEKK